jgi:hypothetical protein
MAAVVAVHCAEKGSHRYVADCPLYPALHDAVHVELAFKFAHVATALLRLGMVAGQVLTANGEELLNQRASILQIVTYRHT